MTNAFHVIRKTLHMACSSAPSFEASVRPVFESRRLQLLFCDLHGGCTNFCRASKKPWNNRLWGRRNKIKTRQVRRHKPHALFMPLLFDGGGQHFPQRFLNRVHTGQQQQQEQQQQQQQPNHLITNNTSNPSSAAQPQPPLASCCCCCCCCGC